MKFKKSVSLGLAAFVALAAVPFASANAPERPDVPDLTDIISDFRAAQQELVQERRALAESLRDKTTEERRHAIADYQAKNEDRIALHRALGEQLREMMKNARPTEPVALSVEDVVVPERPEISAPVKDLIEGFQATRDALIQARLALLADMREAKDEDRAAALADLREQNQEIVAAQKEMAKQIREAVLENREDRRNNN